MAANPTLVLAPDGMRVPAPFPSEVILCQRKGMGFNIDGVNTRGGRLAQHLRDAESTS
jgi:hypothetical protein